MENEKTNRKKIASLNKAIEAKKAELEKLQTLKNKLIFALTPKQQTELEKLIKKLKAKKISAYDAVCAIGEIAGTAFAYAAREEIQNKIYEVRDRIINGGEQKND